MKAGWQIKKLGDICQTGSGGTPLKSKKEFYDKGNIPWLMSGEVGQGDVLAATHFITKAGLENSSARIFPKNTVLVAMYGATAGEVGLLRFESSTNQAVCGISPNEHFIPEFLYFCLLSKKDELISQATGNAQPNISQIKIKNTKIPVPTIDEQQRIVTILDEAFESIATATANAKKNLTNARELFESYLQTIIENKGVNWKDKTLGDVCTLYQGIAINSKTKHALVEKSDLPLLRIKDLKNNTVEQYIDPNNYPVNALVNEDDILYTRTGSLGLVFRGKRGVLHNNSFKVVPNEELAKDYLFIWLQNPSFKSKIMKLALKAAQPDITHAIFKIQDIAIPPLKEQRLIIKKLDALSAETHRLEAIYQQKLTALDELKKSILNQAFSGQLN